MKFRLSRLDVDFERSFAEPVFEVPKSAIEFLKSLYENLSPAYPVAMADLSATAAHSLGEVAIRASLFEGKGLIEIGVEKFEARFEGVLGERDIKIIRDVIDRSQEALHTVFPNIQFKGANIKASAWLICEGGEEGVDQLFQKYGTPKVEISPKKFGAKKVKSFIHSDLLNEQDGWAITFLMQRSKIPNAQLFLLCAGAYLEGMKFQTFPEQADHFESIYRGLLAHYELEPEVNE